MPSGPKKRLRARRKKQGSPATDANSDRETEAMSITGSMDVDDLDSGLDTPIKTSVRPSFLDREAVSSQTDEWIRVSDFDVGTPTSQTGETEPSAEYVDNSSSGRRSLDKLAEWETVSGENIAERQEESINSLEEEPSEVEVVSGHSSESYTHLTPPAQVDKDGNSYDSERKERLGKSSSVSSSSSCSDEKSLPHPSTINESSVVDSVPKVEEVLGSYEDPGEKEVVHEVASDPDVSASDEPELAEEPIPDDVELPGQGNGLSHAIEASIPARDLDDEKEITSISAKDITEVETPLTSNVNENALQEDDGELPSRVDESVATSSLDVEDKEVNGDGKISISKGVASASADLDDVKRTVDELNLNFGTIMEKSLSHSQELTVDTIAVKELETSQGSEPQAFVDERHLSATLVDKNGIEKERTQLEPKSSNGCCGVISWLLGWDR